MNSKLSMTFTLFGLILTNLFAVQQGSSQTNPRKFYKYDVIETTSPSLDVIASPSINDFGDVAFVGRITNAGRTVFRNTIGQPSVNMMPGLSPNPNQNVGGRVQINNSGQIIQHTIVTGTSPVHNFLRRINGVNNFTLIAAANAGTGFNDFAQIFTESIAINNAGEPVFVTSTGTATPTVTTGIRPLFFTLQSPLTGSVVNPAISDLDEIVFRTGGQLGDPLRLFTYDFSDSLTIADINDGFTAIGQSPGISDLSEIIVFYGILNQAGADELGTNPGPGIFASIKIDEKKGLRSIVRLAGRLIEDISAPGGNNDGVCDPGETCMQGELGFNLAGNPIFFNSFDFFSRVAIAHQSVGAAGIEDDIFVVSFLATPNIANDNPERPFSDQTGLWTLTTQIKNEGGILREKPVVPVPVVQVGDVINSRTVTAINVYDQIANVRTPGSSATSPGDHRLAFHLQTKNGNMIIRAERNVETPVILIPGIMGSRLVEVSGSTQTERWPGLNAGILTGANLERLRPSQNANIIATDVIRFFLPGELKPIYGPMLSNLSISGGLREYQVEGNPDRRTAAGCDMNQRFNDPRLFVFAYDWRKSNIENANTLKDYVNCIRRFHPGTKVDIVAHSMGGLLGRRYIIANPGSHDVRKMITIGSPFLGAPEALQVTETGKPRFLDGIVGKVVPRFVTNKIKNLAIESPAVHELFPSEGFFTLGGRPFVEETFDINGDGIVPQE
ncbi:MAG: esterase/lipase family protein, partial [Pyrinomonadaceae bacterium]